jgi:hypothetical protein
MCGLSSSAIADESEGPASLASTFETAVGDGTAATTDQQVDKFAAISHPVYFDYCLGDGHKISIQVDTTVLSFERNIQNVTAALKGAFMPLEQNLASLSYGLSEEDIRADGYEKNPYSLHNYFRVQTAKMGYKALETIQAIAPEASLISFPTMSNVFFYEGLPLDLSKPFQDTGADYEFDNDENIYPHGDCVPNFRI